MTIVLLAALAMFLQDVIAVLLVQAEARDRAHLAAALDSVGWLVAITTTFISVDTLSGHDTTKKIAVIVAVTGANYAGTYLGVRIGKRYVKTVRVPASHPPRNPEGQNEP